MMKLASRPIEIDGLNIGMVKFLKILHTLFIVSKQIIQIKILNEINFLLIIMYILHQFKVFIYSPNISKVY